MNWICFFLPPPPLKWFSDSCAWKGNRLGFTGGSGLLFVFFPVTFPLPVAVSSMPSSPAEAELELKGKAVAPSDSPSLNYSSIKTFKQTSHANQFAMEENWILDKSKSPWLPKFSVSSRMRSLFLKRRRTWTRLAFMACHVQWHHRPHPHLAVPADKSSSSILFLGP